MAGVNRDGIAGPKQTGPIDLRRGAFGVQARAQYRAMAVLRWHIFVNGLRSKLGAVELGVRTVMYLLYAGLGMGAGAMLGVGAYFVVSDREWPFLPVLFWALCILWQTIPVMLASLQEQFDLGILLRFPVGFGSYFLLYTVFGLVDVSTMLGVICCVGVWAGITAARPELFAWTAIGLAIFALFNILLARTIFAWVDRWLAQRKTREIVGAIFMLLLLSLQLLNPALHQRRHQRHLTPQERYEEYQKVTAEFLPWLKTIQAVERWLPPGLAARAVKEADEARPLAGLGSLTLLGLYSLTVGGALASRLRGEYRGENLGQAPKRSKAVTNKGSDLSNKAVPAGREARRRLVGSGPVVAMMEKDLRSLLRTLPLLWALGMPVLMVFIFASVFRNSGSSAASTFSFALPLCVAYALLGFTQLFYNSLGAEGAGIQLLFLSPTPIRTVLLAKNLFHSALFLLDALLAAAITTLRLGLPDGTTLAATAAWLLFALPCNLAAGNIFSLTMPHRINPGRISRQRGSQANALFSLLVQLAVLGAGAAVFGLCWALERLWLAVPVFLVLAAAAFFVWLRVLRNVDGIASQRKDDLIATLMKAA